MPNATWFLNVNEKLRPGNTRRPRGQTTGNLQWKNVTNAYGMGEVVQPSIIPRGIVKSKIQSLTPPSSPVASARKSRKQRRRSTRRKNRRSGTRRNRK